MAIPILFKCAPFVLVGSLLVSPHCRYIVLNDTSGFKVETFGLLGLNVGPGENVVSDYIRFFILIGIFLVGFSHFEDSIHAYAATVEMEVNDARAGQRSSTRGRLDILLVKALVVFFPDVEVQRLSFAQAARAVPNHKIHRRVSSISRYIGSGMNLLSFHRSLSETNTPVLQQMIAVSSGVVLILSAFLVSFKTPDWLYSDCFNVLKAGLVLRIFVPISSAANVIVEDQISKAGAPTKASWGVLFNSLQILLWLLTIVFVLAALGADMSSYITGLGFGSIAAAFAAQRTLAEMFATASLLAERPFEIGDRIEFQGVEATVLSIGFRTTQMKTTYAGEVMVVPNGDLVTKTIFNRRKMDERRVKGYLRLSHDTPYDKVEKAIGMVCEAVRATENCSLVYAHIMEIGLDGILLEYVLVVHSNESKIFKDCLNNINLEILRTFSTAKIKFTKRNCN
uniref:Mechanosensitive ion channel MscS domain-containing protein n=1 Tax=Mucochytrium quahogii TaxID=96639 RepID=A0A7S2RX46_9STRA|mmetsp:Transcript_4087/g.6025  ORF Transcript_4087/g.6025 Transcript_4087/m.6025 type:complete len:453 (+) Transcript_4087:98-1456(+)|eukprot:CAMPEP_0203745300 /NCGR_PEP_ID=MMETSP0098-20131031/1083_1 /ASSEMBLY_ACC=CAM_ASM_000208 /TAXON_ID=96639 /ORGANISM=" , Strain NY0313808BC1" /LENGTH=452 /DNA_ID=CAMNT_0050633041 /DNA_START=624 /DNA_END=1982 /DNA_ORIENTATION=-